VFDTLVPYQYNEQDRRAGYYFGKDRRGQLHRVPLMTLSIGVVTNQHRRFAHPAQVSELATEYEELREDAAGSSLWLTGATIAITEKKEAEITRPRRERHLSVVRNGVRVDPAKVPAGGLRARCSVCSNVFAVSPTVPESAPALHQSPLRRRRRAPRRLHHRPPRLPGLRRH